MKNGSGKRLKFLQCDLEIICCGEQDIISTSGGFDGEEDVIED